MWVLPKTAFRVTCFHFRVSIPLSVGCYLFVLVLLVMPGEARDDLFQADVFSTHQHFPYNPTITISFTCSDNNEAASDSLREILL